MRFGFVFLFICFYVVDVGGYRHPKCPEVWNQATIHHPGPCIHKIQRCWFPKCKMIMITGCWLYVSGVPYIWYGMIDWPFVSYKITSTNQCLVSVVVFSFEKMVNQSSHWNPWWKLVNSPTTNHAEKNGRRKNCQQQTPPRLTGPCRQDLSDNQLVDVSIESWTCWGPPRLPRAAEIRSCWTFISLGHCSHYGT